MMPAVVMPDNMTFRAGMFFCFRHSPHYTARLSRLAASYFFSSRPFGDPEWGRAPCEALAHASRRVLCCLVSSGSVALQRCGTTFSGLLLIEADSEIVFIWAN